MNARLRAKIRKDFRKLVRCKHYNTNTIIMRWCEETKVEGHDPNLAGSPRNTQVEKEEAMSALVHIVNYETTGYSRFLEATSGNLIVDFLHNVDLVGKSDPVDVTRKNIRFEFQGEIYTQKGAGRSLEDSADVVMDDGAVCVTILLERAE